MAFKTFLTFCACVAFAFSAAIDSTTPKPQVDQPQNPASNFTNATSGLADAAQRIGDRLQNAFNQTYQEERNSVSDGFNSTKDLLQQNIETGANLTKTAFDVGTVFPKFGKNLILGDNETRSEN